MERWRPGRETLAGSNGPMSARGMIARAKESDNPRSPEAASSHSAVKEQR